MCSPCGRERYTTRQLKPPSTPPQSPATPSRPQVITARLSCGGAHSDWVVGERAGILARAEAVLTKASHPISSRQPGVGPGGQVHGAERQKEYRVPPRTSENPVMTKFAEFPSLLKNSLGARIGPS